jgi:hypothetical protein
MREGNFYEVINNKSKEKFTVLSKHDAWAIKVNSKEFIDLFHNLKNKFGHAPAQIFMDTSARPLHYLVKGILEETEGPGDNISKSNFLKLVRPITNKEMAEHSELKDESFKYQHEKGAPVFREALKQRIGEIISSQEPPYLFIDEYYSDGKSLQEIKNIMNELNVPKDNWVYFAFHGNLLEGAISEKTERQKDLEAGVNSFMGAGQMMDIRHGRHYYSGVIKSKPEEIEKKYSSRITENDFKNDKSIGRMIEKFGEIAKENNNQEFSDILQKIKTTMQSKNIWRQQRDQLIGELRTYMMDAIRKDMKLLGKKCAQLYLDNKNEQN